MINDLYIMLIMINDLYRRFYMEISKFDIKRAIVFHNRIAPQQNIFIKNMAITNRSIMFKNEFSSYVIYNNIVFLTKKFKF